MSKDPAILFYTSDFLTGTTLMSHHQVGIYIRLICILHQHGGIIDLKAFEAFTGNDEMIKSKFIIDNEIVFHKRLMEEMEKRSKKSNSMSDNAKVRWNKCKSNAKALELHNGLHMPIESENEDEINTIKQQVQEVFSFFCVTLRKKILLSKDRQRIIELRLKEGRSVDELKRAITNFSMDDWPDRHKFCDLVYAIGVRNKVDNLDKWLVGKDGGKPVPAIHPKTCPECFGNGIVYPQGGGKAVVCWVKY